MAQELHAWFQAWVMVPPVIAGVRLMPYSLSHAMFLDALRSPLLDAEKPTATAQIWEALGVCSRDHAGNVRVYSCGRVDRAVNRAARRWGSKPVAPIESAFRTYLADYNVTPPLLPSKSRRGMAAPPYNHMVRVLCRVYGVPLDQALNFPAGLARCLYETDSEAEGVKSLAHPVDVLLSKIRADLATAKRGGDEALADSLREEYRKLAEAFPPEKGQS